MNCFLTAALKAFSNLPHNFEKHNPTDRNGLHQLHGKLTALTDLIILGLVEDTNKNEVTQEEKDEVVRQCLEVEDTPGVTPTLAYEAHRIVVFYTERGARLPEPTTANPAT